MIILLISSLKPMLWVLIRMSTHNIGFYEDLTKIIFELSSNTHLISSAGKTEQVIGLQDKFSTCGLS